jgi:transposase
MTTSRGKAEKPKLQLKTAAAVEILWRNGYTRRQIRDILAISAWSVRFHLQAGGWVPRFDKKRRPLAPPRAKGRPVTMPKELRSLVLRYDKAHAE